VGVVVGLGVNGILELRENGGGGVVYCRGNYAQMDVTANELALKKINK
jgi:hypothetical protein